MLHKQPEFVHRFYGTNSEMIHGDFNDFNVETPIVGQVKIREHIRELKFEKCWTRVACLDAFQTIGNGIVVQVVGEISNNAAPLRRFAQTFVLGPQERQGKNKSTFLELKNPRCRSRHFILHPQRHLPIPGGSLRGARSGEAGQVFYSFSFYWSFYKLFKIFHSRNVKSVTGDKKIMFRGFFKKKTAQLAELVTTPEKSDSESDICSICFEVWTSTGSHRYVNIPLWNPLSSNLSRFRAEKPVWVTQTGCLVFKDRLPRTGLNHFWRASILCRSFLTN